MRHKRHHGSEDHSRGVRALPTVATVAAIGLGVAALAFARSPVQGGRAPVRRTNNGPMEADCSGSECFDALTYEDGVVTAEFNDRKGTIEEYAMTRAEAKEWFDSPSLGQWFNSSVR